MPSEQLDFTRDGGQTATFLNGNVNSSDESSSLRLRIVSSADGGGTSMLTRLSHSSMGEGIMPCLGLGWYGPKEEDILIVDGSGGEPVAQGVLPDADKMCASRCARQVCRAASLQRMLLPLARPTLF